MSEIAQTTTLVTAICSLIGLVAASVHGATRVATIEARIAGIDVKVDTMWAFQMRRALSEAVSSGLASVNSPIVFTPEAIASLDPIRDELLAFWKTVPEGTSDAAALLLIEARFGEDLLRLVCIPCGLSHGACLLLAMTIAKGSSQISLV
jgi:hypothetical protein